MTVFELSKILNVMDETTRVKIAFMIDTEIGEVREQEPGVALEIGTDEKGDYITIIGESTLGE